MRAASRAERIGAENSTWGRVSKRFLAARDASNAFFSSVCACRALHSGVMRAFCSALFRLDSRCKSGAKILAYNKCASAQEDQNRLNCNARPQWRKIYACNRWNQAANWPQHRLTQRRKKSMKRRIAARRDHGEEPQI